MRDLIRCWSILLIIFSFFLFWKTRLLAWKLRCRGCSMLNAFWEAMDAFFECLAWFFSSNWFHFNFISPVESFLSIRSKAYTLLGASGILKLILLPSFVDLPLHRCVTEDASEHQKVIELTVGTLPVVSCQYSSPTRKLLLHVSATRFVEG